MLWDDLGRYGRRKRYLEVCQLLVQSQAAVIVIGVAVPSSLPQNIGYSVVYQHSSNWCVAATQTLRNGLNVGNHVLLLPGV
jgi:hypothetical protein